MVWGKSRDSVPLTDGQSLTDDLAEVLEELIWTAPNGGPSSPKIFRTNLKGQSVEQLGALSKFEPLPMFHLKHPENGIAPTKNNCLVCTSIYHTDHYKLNFFLSAHLLN